LLALCDDGREVLGGGVMSSSLPQATRRYIHAFTL
jgi:hypothetical protein